MAINDKCDASRVSFTAVLFTGALAGLLSVAPAGAADPIQIGSRSEVSEVALEVDEASGHLLAVLRYDTAGEDCFAVNLSTDGGDSWSETYEQCSAHGIGNHLGTTVVGGFLYVGYISHIAVNSARVIRVQTSDGVYDPIYGSVTVLSAAVQDTICHIALTSNHASYDDHLYLFAITEGNLVFFWTDEDGGAGSEPWHEVTTGVTDAWCWMLEATYNDGFWLGSGYNPLVAYQSSWDLYLWRYHGIDGPEHFLFDADAPVFEYPGSIAAADDEMRAVYWSYSYQTKSCASSAAGSSPTCHTWDACNSGFAADVVAAPGGGFGAVYAPDNNDCLVRIEDASGQWSDSTPCHGSSLPLRGPVAIAPMQAFTPFSYGLVAIANDPLTGTPYFIRAPIIFNNGFESGDPSAWSSVTP